MNLLENTDVSGAHHRDNSKKPQKTASLERDIFEAKQDGKYISIRFQPAMYQLGVLKFVKFFMKLICLLSNYYYVTTRRGPLLGTFKTFTTLLISFYLH